MYLEIDITYMATGAVPAFVQADDAQKKVTPTVDACAAVWGVASLGIKPLDLTKRSLSLTPVLRHAPQRALRTRFVISGKYMQPNLSINPKIVRLKIIETKTCKSWHFHLLLKYIWLNKSRCLLNKPELYDTRGALLQLSLLPKTSPKAVHTNNHLSNLQSVTWYLSGEPGKVIIYYYLHRSSNQVSSYRTRSLSSFTPGEGGKGIKNNKKKQLD